MGLKPRRGPGTDLFRSPSGEGWRLSAENLTLVEGTKRTSFDDYRSLLAEAEKRINAQEKRRLRLAGDLAARARGAHNQVAPEHIAAVRAQLGPRRSIWTDAWSELAEVLKDPSGYTGGVLLFDGDVTVSGSWDAGDYAAVVVLGNCTVEGLLYQYQTEPWFIVTGDLVMDNLVMAGNLDVGGSIRARQSVEFESGLGYTNAGDEIAAPTLFVWDMPVTCNSVSTELYVSRVKLGDRVKCQQADVGRRIEQLWGPELAKHFHPCVLDYHGVENPAADPNVPELSLERRKLIHLLGLPVRAQ